MNQRSNRGFAKRAYGQQWWGWFMWAVVAFFGLRDSAAADDASPTEKQHADVIENWCDAIEQGDSCSCIQRICVLRRAVRDKKLRLQAGTPPREFVFCYVPPGRTKIGLLDEEQTALAQSHGNVLLGHNALPICNADFIEGFFILDREVSCEQFDAVMAWGGKNRKPSERRSVPTKATTPQREEDMNNPKASVSWRDACGFCDDLRAELSYEIRLPTEVEWEYSARGPRFSLFPGGRDAPIPLDQTTDEDYGANVRGGVPGTIMSFQTLGNRDVSWCGAHDLSGNLSEWCADIYRSSLKDVLEDNHMIHPGLMRLEDHLTDSKEPNRSFRGASFGDSRWEAAASLRRSMRETKASDRIGFRPVLTLRFRKSKCEPVKHASGDHNREIKE